MMLEYWKRTEKQLALEWGMIDFEINEIDRSEFRHEDIIQSYVTGKKMRYFSPSKRSKYVYQSGGLVGLMILCAVGVVAR